MTINISEIARLAGVSKSTVSRVLNGHADVMPQTRQRVQQIIKEYDYYPKAYAKAISQQRSSMICLVMPYTPQNSFSNPYYTEVIRGIAIVAQQQGFQMMFIYSGQGEYMLAAKQRSADGIIFINPMKNDYPNIQELRKMDFPLVLTSRTVGTPNICSVYIDDYRGSALAMEHLISRNHRHIGMINIPNEFPSGEKRFEGYRDTLEKHRIPYREEYVIHCEDVQIENGLRAMEKLLLLPDITAVYITDDMMAAGAIRAIQMQGKSIPGDYSIVGFDDQPLSGYLSPALTTIRHDACLRGRVAAQMLFDVMAERPVESPHIIDVELIVRDSTRSI